MKMHTNPVYCIKLLYTISNSPLVLYYDSITVTWFTWFDSANSSVRQGQAITL